MILAFVLSSALASTLALQTQCVQTTKKLIVETVVCPEGAAHPVCEHSHITYGDWILRDCPAASNDELAVLAKGKAHVMYYRMAALVRLYNKGGFKRGDFPFVQSFPNAVILKHIADLEAGKVTATQLQNQVRSLWSSYSSYDQKVYPASENFYGYRNNP